MPDGRIATVVAVGLISPAQAATFYANTFGAPSELWSVETTGGGAVLVGNFDITGVDCP